MRYPEIIETLQNDPNNITLRLRIPAEIIFFQGHFPNTPILPGVAQVDWAIFFAHKFLGIDPQKCLNIEQIKFTKVIKPNSKISLEVKLENNTLHFKYFNDDIIYSKGKIKA
jgi:3-hydroxyacyl-[acyl-carrier-protein] dehydratase